MVGTGVDFRNTCKKTLADLGFRVEGTCFPFGDARLQAPLHFLCIPPHLLEPPFELLSHLGDATAGQY